MFPLLACSDRNCLILSDAFLKWGAHDGEQYIAAFCRRFSDTLILLVLLVMISLSQLQLPSCQTRQPLIYFKSGKEKCRGTGRSWPHQRGRRRTYCTQVPFTLLGLARLQRPPTAAATIERSISRNISKIHEYIYTIKKHMNMDGKLHSRLESMSHPLPGRRLAMLQTRAARANHLQHSWLRTAVPTVAAQRDPLRDKT